MHTDRACRAPSLWLASGFNQGCSPGCETPSGELCDKFEKNGAYACCESAMEPTLHAGGPAELSPRTFADLELPGAEPIDQYR